jgi:hypothetical protein
MQRGIIYDELFGAGTDAKRCLRIVTSALRHPLNLHRLDAGLLKDGTQLDRFRFHELRKLLGTG